MLQNQKLVAFGQRQANLEHSHSCKEEEEDDLFAPHAPAIIFDALKLDEEVPFGFNAVRIPLDATLKSDLNWKLERTAAEKYIHQGFRIFWDIQLGIGRPNGLAFPLTNHSQFLSLSIALEHFRDTIWKDFREKTVGLCLYRGSADFSSGFLWNEEELGNFRSWLKEIFEDVSTFTSETLSIVSSFEEINPQNLAASVEGDRLLAIYCRNITGRYLGTLSDCVPDTLQCYVLLDIQNILDPLLQVQLTAKESFSRINLGIR
nr:hypothetical protein [Parachlamydiaceae bacterium]